MTERELARVLQEAAAEAHWSETGRAALRTQMQKGNKIMKKKLMVSLAFALVLALALGVAVAAGLGVFARLGENPDADRRLAALDRVSAAVGECVTLEGGATVTVDQAYWDGERIFVAYTATGMQEQTARWDGDPAQVDWTMTYPGETYGTGVMRDNDEALRSLMADGGRAQTTGLFIHDCLRTPDGGYLDIMDGNEQRMPDGTVMGWKECVPEEGMTITGDELTCSLSIAMYNTIWYQDETGLYTRFEQTNRIEAPFTLRRGEGLRHMTGASAGDNYTASADLKRSPVDVYGDLTVTGPASWAESWRSWETGHTEDMICDWQAMLDGELREDLMAVDHIREEGDNVVFMLKLAADEGVREIKLIPVYSESGLHLAEGMVLTAEE